MQAEHLERCSAQRKPLLHVSYCYYCSIIQCPSYSLLSSSLYLFPIPVDLWRWYPDCLGIVENSDASGLDWYLPNNLEERFKKINYFWYKIIKILGLKLFLRRIYQSNSKQLKFMKPTKQKKKIKISRNNYQETFTKPKSWEISKIECNNIIFIIF